MTERSKAYLWLIFITMLWGSSFPVMERCLSIIKPYTFITIRYLGSAIIMSIIFTKSFKKINFDIFKKASTIGIPFGIAAIGQMIGLSYTSSTNAAFITGLTVAVVPLIVFVLDKKIPDKKTLIGILISILGVGIMTLSNYFKINQGDFIVLLSTIGFSLQIYFIDKISKGLDIVLLTILELYTVGSIAFPFALIIEGLNCKIDLNTICSMAFIIFLCTIFAIYIQNKVQPKANPTHTAVIFLLEPVSALAFSFMLGDKILKNQILGGLIIIIGTVIIINKDKEKEKRK